MTGNKLFFCVFFFFLAKARVRIACQVIFLYLQNSSHTITGCRKRKVLKILVKVLHSFFFSSSSSSFLYFIFYFSIQGKPSIFVHSDRRLLPFTSSPWCRSLRTWIGKGWKGSRGLLLLVRTFFPLFINVIA